jgi:uncharacterized membrane protein
MTRALVAAFAGLLIGAAMHIAIVLLVPLFAVADAWTKVAALGADGVFRIVPAATAGSAALPGDPRMFSAICRFDLTDAPIRIRATLPDTFWSVALFDRRARNLYSLNDSSSEQSRLDLLVVTPAQAATLGANPPASLQTAILAELPFDAGMAVIRAFVTDAAAAAEVAAALATADCNAPL